MSEKIREFICATGSIVTIAAHFWWMLWIDKNDKPFVAYIVLSLFTFAILYFLIEVVLIKEPTNE